VLTWLYRVTRQVESESLYSWLRALCSLCRAEAALSSASQQPSTGGGASPLPDAVLGSFYHALTALQASGVGGSQGHVHNSLAPPPVEPP
jgi:hypothetical protein